MIALSDLVMGLEYTVLGAPLTQWGDAPVADIITCSEQAGVNTVFVCTRTALRDGHNAARAAFAAGCRIFVAERGLGLAGDATVLIVEDCATVLSLLCARCYGEPVRGLTVLGITGTVGKTSVVYLLEHILRRAGHRVATLTDEGTLLNGVRTPRTAIVPDAPEIWRTLREFATVGADLVLLELSAYQLAQKSALHIPFTAVLLTNLYTERYAEAHFCSPEVYRAAKECLLASEAAFAVLPVSCAEIPTRAKRVCFGEGGDLFATDVHTDPAFVTHFTLCEGGIQTPITLPAIGTDACENALCAAALARIVGCTHAQIAAALAEGVVSGRLECIAHARQTAVFVDAGYTPMSIAHALATLRPLTRGRLSVLLGSVGGRAFARRAPLAVVALQYADFVYFTADNPDRESPEAICEELLAAAPDKRRLVLIPDREQAIRRAVADLRRGDVLLLAGKGNERYQLVCGVRVPFCERSITKDAMAHR